MSNVTIERTAPSLAAIANDFDHRADDLDKRLNQAGHLLKKIDQARLRAEAEIWRQAAGYLRETTLKP